MTMTIRLQNFPRIYRRENYGDGKNHNYTAFRQEIREDCQRRCVYCDAREEEIGGDAIFHIDHFRPQKYFPKLVDTPTNLVWACCRCNLLKRDNWPALGEGDDTTFKGEFGFIDPFTTDRAEYFAVNNTGELGPLKAPSRYLIERLALNRPFLRLSRQKRFVVLQTLNMLDQKEYDIRAKKYGAELRLGQCELESERAADIQELINAYYEYLLLIQDYRDKISLLI